MKRRLASHLVCPGCKEELDLEVLEEADGEIAEGSLTCVRCDSAFPIRKGIPRFAASDAYADTFSFEWNQFHDVQMDILNATDESEKTFRGKTGWFPADVRGKRILDVGVGAGRFAEVASRWGAEVVGVDLSYAVDAAYGNVGDRANVHIVQADLFRMPFRPASFDAVYSIGVLHHTPDTREAFRAAATYLRKGGELAVFVYAHGHYAVCSDLWRRVTTRLPLRLVYGVSALSIPLYPIYRIPVVGLGLRFLFPMSMHSGPRWRWLDTFDWYTPKYQHKHAWPEVHDWFLQEGFEDIRLLMETKELAILHVNMRGRKAR